MRLGLDPQQERLVAKARAILGERLPPERLNAVEALPEGHDPGLLAAMLGERLHAVPDLLELGLVLEECGRAVLRSPFFTTAATLQVLRRFGSGPAAAGIAARIEAGTTATLALAGQDLVEWPAAAVLVIVAGEQGLRAHEDVGVEVVASFDGESVGRIRPRAMGMALSGRLPGYELDRIRALVSALRAAEIAGGAREVLDMTVEHVCSRRQFGRALGTLQAVQHLCAEMAIAVEGARLAALEALWKADQGLPSLREAAVAAWFCGQTYEQAALTASELHGGLGYLKEYHLHHHFRRAKAQRLRLGTERAQLERVAIEMFDERPEPVAAPG